MRYALITCLLIGLCSCSSKPVNITADKDFHWDRAISVAIIPFEGDFEKDQFSPEQQLAICTHLGKEFYRSFAPLSFEDLEPRLMRQYLLKNKLNSKLLSTSKSDMKKLGLDLGIDLILTAKVKDYSYTSLVLHERWFTAMELSIYECETGKLIWQYAHEQSRQELHAPTSPGAVASEVLGVLMRDKQMDILVQRLCRELADSIPQPQINDQPLIKNITFSPHNFLKRGEKVKVTIYGSPGMKAFFRIGDNEENIGTVEKPRGVYNGEYRINEKIDSDNLKLRASIQNRLNESTPWQDSKNTINIDQVPPSAMTFKVQSLGNTLQVSWEAPEKNIPYYIIYRRSAKDKEFHQLCTSSDRLYIDKEIQAKVRYFYKICAIDRAGNKGAESKEQSAYYCPSGPTILTKLPLELFPEGSPYIIPKNLSLKKDNTLTISPGTEIILKAGTLQVKGKLIAGKDGGRPCIFSTSQGDLDALHFMDGANGNLTNCSFNGFKTAISAKNATVSIRYGKISHCTSALQIQGDSRVNIYGMKFSECHKTLALTNSNYLKLHRCGFNNNHMNLSFNANSTVEAEDNYWGVLPEIFHTKDLKVIGPLKIERCLVQNQIQSSPLAVSALKEYLLFSTAKSRIRKFHACKSLIKKDKDYKDAYYWKAEYLISTLQFEEAKQVINEALERFKQELNFTKSLTKLKNSLTN